MATKWGPYKSRRPVEDRLAEKIDFDGADGCWLWTASTNHGYGQINLGRNDGMARAHRAVWELFVGPIPEGLQIDHLCRVRRCVNPDHLELVTMQENLLRSPLTLIGNNVRKTHCNKGHAFVGHNVIWVNDGRGRACRVCKYADNKARAARKRGAQ